MSVTTLTGDDVLGPMLDALGTLYGPETMLRRCHEKFADDPTVIAELRYELEAQRELFEAARRRVHQLEAVRDRLARERDHQTDRADGLQEQLWQRDACGKHTLTGDLTCSREAGHDGQHVGGSPAVSWADAREDADQPAQGCPVGRRLTAGVWSSCTLDAGHDGDHQGPVQW